MPTAAVFFGIFGVTLSLGLAAHGLTYPRLLRRGLLDVPNQRSSHSVPTVRGGGLGVVIAVLCGLGITWVLLGRSEADFRAELWFGAVVLCFAVLGWLDDIREVPVGVRLGGQVGIAAAAALTSALMGELSPALALLALPGAVLYVNAANFMDGVNGISGMHGLVVGATFAGMGQVLGSQTLTAAGLITAAAFLSFLPWNVPQPRMFIGDVGSYALGAAAWGLCVLAVSSGAPLLVAGSPLIIYLSDVLTTLIRRARRGARLYEAHREHSFQRVQQATDSHTAAALTATLATAACGGLGVLGLYAPESAAWAALFAVGIVMGYLATPWLLAHRAGPTTVRIESDV